MPLTTSATCSFDLLGENSLLKHNVREKVHLVLKQLGIASEGQKVVGYKAPVFTEEFIDALYFRTGLVFGNSGNPRHKYPPGIGELRNSAGVKTDLKAPLSVLGDDTRFGACNCLRSNGNTYSGPCNLAPA